MKILFLTAVLAATVAMGQDLLYFPSTSVATGATVTITIARVNGQPIFFGLRSSPTLGETNQINWSLVTTAGTGSSMVAAKTLATSGSISNSVISSNLANTVYLYGDSVVLTVANIPLTTNNVPLTVDGVLMLKTP